MLLTFLAQLASAQGWVSAPPMPVMYQTIGVAGVPVTCTNAYGNPVAFVYNEQLGDVGVAYPTRTPPLIVLNPRVLTSLPPAMQLFFVAHECGHHQGLNETQADCWAARTGARQGWFTFDALYQAAIVMQNNPGDFTHLPGPARVQTMAACMAP